MKEYKLFLIFSLLSLLTLVGAPYAGYWFQSGARAVGNTNQNNGASVEIQTIIPQTLVKGSMAFWVGETLVNGAFLQVGYLIPNDSGNLRTNCTSNGCSNNEFVQAGSAEWFYEYFTSGNSATFYGNTGPVNSAGVNGTFNRYSFYSLGNTWYFTFNNKTVGSVNLGTSDSGPYQPIAIGEIANTSNASTRMNDVTFANLSAYKYDMFLPVQSAFGTINYGVGSMTNIPNPYGIKEIGTRTNYFEVGSGLPTSENNTRLWNLGYRLTVNSSYGNISSRNSYVAYSLQTISAPAVINLTPTSRVAFTGWTGSGLGFYTGNQKTVQLLVTSNITETANWQTQYLVNVTSPYGRAIGSGWYVNGSTVTYSIANTSFLGIGGKEFRFYKWNNNSTKPTKSMLVSGPHNITALWQYGVELQAINANGQQINVSQFVVNDARVNSTPFLTTNGTSVVTGAYYKGVLMPANVNITQNSSETVPIKLQIYDLTIKTTDFLGSPVNASVNITYKNGTKVSIYSGPNGTVDIPNVPYGYGQVSSAYFGEQDNQIEMNGLALSEKFISPVNIVIIVALLAIFAYVVYRNMKIQGSGKTQKKPKAEG